MFKRTAQGKYTIVVSKYGPMFFSKEGLYSYASTNLGDNCLSLTEESVEAEIKKIRSYAALNKIEDTKLLEELKKDFEEKINYNAEMIHEMRGSAADLNNSICWGALGSVSLTAAAASILYRKSVEKNFNAPDHVPLGIACLAAAASGYSYFKFCKSLSEWFNPRYEEKCQKLSFILGKIDQSLATPRISEEEITVLQS